MKLKISIFIVLFSTNLLNSQNLVPNSSFETYEKCPVSSSSIPYQELVKDWFMPTMGTPDYFNECSVKAGVPMNWAGQRPALDGKGYIGLIGRWNFETKDNKECKREYIQAKLINKLEAGKKYCVSFYTVLSDNSQFAIDGIGAYLSENKIDSTEFNANFNFPPQIQNITNKFIYNTNWKQICGVFTAEGNEKYITIGNFKSDPETRWTKRTRELSIKYAYFYIDNVSVMEIKDVDDCNCPKEMLDFNSKVQNNEISANEVEKFTTEKLNIGQSLYLNSVQFVRNDQELMPEFVEELNLMVKFLNENPNLSLKLSTFADIEVPEDNWSNLIKARNRTVLEYLISKGISEERLEIDEEKGPRLEPYIEFVITKL